MDSIDKKIDKSANDDLDGLESCLNNLEYVDFEQLKVKAKDMIDDCSKEEIKKVLQLLINIERKTLNG